MKMHWPTPYPGNGSSWQINSCRRNLKCPGGAGLASTNPLNQHPIMKQYPKMGLQAQCYLSMSVAPKTLARYIADTNLFVNTIRYKYGYPYVFPVTEHLIIVFMLDQIPYRKIARITQIISAVAHFSQRLGLPYANWKNWPMATAIKKGILRYHGGAPKDRRKALTLQDLKQICDCNIDPEDYNQAVVRTTYLMAYFGLFRMSELLQSRKRTIDPRKQFIWGDIRWYFGPNRKLTGVRIRVRDAKTAKARDEYQYVNVGANHTAICPVAALWNLRKLRILLMRARRYPTNHPLDTHTHNLVFLWKDGSHFTLAESNRYLKVVATKFKWHHIPIPRGSGPPSDSTAWEVVE